ncbi:hypothetical protein ACFZA9_16770 [Streptomyces olivaceus]|uniref:hypothetical protein n=1 Tax=Streptomyces olivaceus TaxID=47716 RepID=UPI0036F0071F
MTNPTTSTAASPVTTTGGRLHGSLPVEQREATGFPGRWVGGTTMVLGPLLMLTGARNVGWGLWGGALATSGLFARTFHARVNHLALQLVRSQASGPTTEAVSAGYGKP